MNHETTFSFSSFKSTSSLIMINGIVFVIRSAQNAFSLIKCCTLRLALIFVLSLSSHSSPVWAEEDQREQMRLAKSYLEATHLSASITSSFSSYVRNTIPESAINADHYKAFSSLLMAEQGTSINQLTEEIANVYARQYTATQLKSAIAFFSSPEGQAFSSKTPETLGIVSQIVSSWRDKVLSRAFLEYCATPTRPCEGKALERAK